jgi:hypothetical protein
MCRLIARKMNIYKLKRWMLPTSGIFKVKWEAAINASKKI